MMRHHKKANVGVMFECLLHEAVASLLEQKKHKAEIAWSIIERHFLSPGAPLGTELAFYESICETNSLSEHQASSFLSEIEGLAVRKRPPTNAIGKLTEEIDMALGAEVLNNYVTNYKLLASLNMLLELYRRDKTPLTISERTTLEATLLEHMTNHPVVPETTAVEEAVDPMVLNMAYKKYVARYHDKLSKSQLVMVRTALCNEGALPEAMQQSATAIRTKLNTIKAEDVKSRVEKLLEGIDPKKGNIEDGLKLAAIADELEG